MSRGSAIYFPVLRTVAGALIEHKFTVRYRTISPAPAMTRTRSACWTTVDPPVMIAGVTVPGKYLVGTPATLNEIQQVGHMIRNPKESIGVQQHCTLMKVVSGR